MTFSTTTLNGFMLGLFLCKGSLIQLLCNTPTLSRGLAIDSRLDSIRDIVGLWLPHIAPATAIAFVVPHKGLPHSFDDLCSPVVAPGRFD
jgi:hypothetical protein